VVPCDDEQIKASRIAQDSAWAWSEIELNSPEDTMLEAWLSQRPRMAEVIFQAWKRGAKFDAWKEHFQYQTWLEAFNAVGLDPAFYTHRERPIDETFPWEHISTSVRKKFLTEDYLWSLQGKTRVDCRQRCFACGILPTFADLRRSNPGEVWQCPEVKSRRIPVEAIAMPGDLILSSGLMPVGD
jgi:hypothetical protein